MIETLVWFVLYFVTSKGRDRPITKIKNERGYFSTMKAESHWIVKLVMVYTVKQKQNCKVTTLYTFCAFISFIVDNFEIQRVEATEKRWYYSRFSTNLPRFDGCSVNLTSYVECITQHRPHGIYVVHVTAWSAPVSRRQPFPSHVTWLSNYLNNRKLRYNNVT